MKAEENTSIPGTESNKPEARPAAPLQALKPEPAKGKKTSALQGMVRQIALALLFVVIGMLVILLALYLPNAAQLRDAQKELDRLVPIETQYIELEQTHERALAQALVYKLMSNSSLLEEALQQNAKERVAQQVAYIEEDLGKLEITKFPELPASLISKFAKVKASLPGNSSGAIKDLQEFYKDLLQLSDNL